MKGVYGDQVYDVLGDSHINTSLKQLLLDAIRADTDPAHLAYMDEIIEGQIGEQLTAVLQERALAAGLADRRGSQRETTVEAHLGPPTSGAGVEEPQDGGRGVDGRCPRPSVA